MSSTRASKIEVSVASPCGESWELMRGAERSRFCEACGLSVHNLRSMRPLEVELLALKSAAGERVCARVSRSAEGQLLMLPLPANAHTGQVRSTLLSIAMAAGLPAAAQVSGAPKLLATAETTVKPTPDMSGVPAKTAVVSGRVLHPDGSPVDTGLVVLRRRDGHYEGGYDGGVYVLDSLGGFEFTRVPGDYDLIVQTGPEHSKQVLSAALHEGYQSFGDIWTVAAQPNRIGTDATDMYGTTLGVLVSQRVSWRTSLRHPIWYVRSVVRRLR